MEPLQNPPPLPYLSELKLFSKNALQNVVVSTPASSPSYPAISNTNLIAFIVLVAICAMIWKYFTSEEGQKKINEWTSHLLLKLYLTDRGEIKTIV